MYALKKDNKFYCNWYYSCGDAGWKSLENCYNMCMIESEIIADNLCSRLSVIYKLHKIEVVKLTEDDLASVIFAKLCHH